MFEITREPAHAYAGPERRAAHSPWVRLFEKALDEIDYGVLLVQAATGRVLLANRSARHALAETGAPLALMQGRELRAAQGRDATALREALAGALRGRRKLLALGDGEARLGVAVVPLFAGTDATMPTLVLLGKRRLCEALSIQWFARLHELTPAETRVLEALCDGHEPGTVARRHQVGIATVRTQIGAIRSKTGIDSMREIVRRVAVLPPMVSAIG